MSEQKLYIVSTSTSVVCPHSLIVLKLLVVGLNKLLTLYLENIDVSASPDPPHTFICCYSVINYGVTRVNEAH